MGKKLFAEYLAEFQQYIKNIGYGNFKKNWYKHDIDRMTFDEIVFICQILWIKNQLTNQIKPKNYPNFTQPVSNSNASSTNNNIFPVRGYITP